MGVNHRKPRRKFKESKMANDKNDEFMTRLCEQQSRNPLMAPRWAPWIEKTNNE